MWLGVVVATLGWSVALCVLWALRLPRGGSTFEAARLQRSLLFAAMASVAGPALLVTTKSWPRAALFLWDPWRFGCFCVAAGHWALSTIEETALYGRKRSLVAGLDGHPDWRNFSVDELGTLLFVGYVFHHFFTALFYVVALQTRQLQALAAFGLFYEMPVCFQFSRELDRRRRPSSFVRAFYAGWFAAFFIARGTPTLVYLYSLVFWRSSLNDLKPAAFIFYHLAATLFSYLNLVYLLLLKTWYDIDLDKGQYKKASCCEKGEDDDEEDGEERGITIESAAAESGNNTTLRPAAAASSPPPREVVVVVDSKSLSSSSAALSSE